IEALAESVPDNGGVVFVPALTGLGAPHWNPDAKGVVWGITRGTTMGHIARATLEAIALQNHEIIQAMQSDYRKPVQMLKVDGGAAANNLMVQFQADILGTEISRPTMLETTALGAAFLAGLAVGTWKDKDELRKVWKEDRRFTPHMSKDKVDEHLRLWDEGIKRV
ncbi:glycerol kinase, partial [bacterium]|nr:glycerol kinase [bacterium]